jgi:hypothetical protein
VTSTSIPVGDAPALRGFGARTRLVCLVLAAALLGAVLAAILVAHAPTVGTTALLPPGSNGVIALDMSASAEHAKLDRIYAALTQLAHSGDRFGLVVFSSRAYEALPPNTPASELAAIARFFHPLAPGSLGYLPGWGQYKRDLVYPTNPWSAAFSFGTSISEGLDLARSILLENHVRRAVWLISDLADAPQDRPLVADSARSYVNSSIALHVIGIDPVASDRRFFERLLGPRGSIIEAKPSSKVRLVTKHAFPIGLVVAAMVTAILLAINELLSTPLRWGPPRRAQETTA